MNDRPKQFLPGVFGADTPIADIVPTNTATPGNGPLAGQTINFDLNLVNFDWITWHNYEWENWVQVDALLGIAVGFLNLRGFWRPTTQYFVGETVIDPENVTSYWTCLVEHTSSTDFEVDKPLYWEEKTDVGANVTSVFGRIGDIVAEEGDYSAFFYTKAEVDASQAAQDSRLDGIDLKFDDYYTKIEQDATDSAQDAAINAIIQDLDDNYYTKTEQDATDAAQDNALLAHVNDLNNPHQVAWDQLTGTPPDFDNYVEVTGDTMTGPLIIEPSTVSDTPLTLRAQTTTLRFERDGGNFAGWITPNSHERADLNTGAFNAGWAFAAYGAAPNDQWAMEARYKLDHADILSDNQFLLKKQADALYGTSSITIGDAFPASPDVASLHYKTAGVVGLYVYYDDGDSVQWVQTNGGGQLNGQFLSLTEQTTQDVAGYVRFDDDINVWNSIFVQEYNGGTWCGYGWSDESGWSRYYLGVDPTTDHMWMEQYDGAGNFTRNVYAIWSDTGAVEFFNTAAVNTDFFIKHGASKNESGVQWLRENGQPMAYLFNDEANDRLRLNAYNSSGQYTGTILDINANATGMFVNVPLYVWRDGADLILNDVGAAANAHVYFRHGNVNHALFYSPAASDVGRLQLNHYNNSGTYLSSTIFFHTNGSARVETGTVFATSGPYYGPLGNFGVQVQNDRGGSVSFGDIGHHGLVGGGGGPVGVYMEIANNNNVNNWGIHCDFVSDIRTKSAVQPSPVEALEDIKSLSAIRWQYNELAPRLKKMKRSNFADIDHPDDLVVEEEDDDAPHMVELGFSSEDIKRIAPGAVYSVNGIERIDYRQVVPHCLRAIQMLTERLEALENA